ncbi:hypothetical protein M9H77_10922 [Catharanthus roseus]|uniref:Uncharacterized protein n=1 Tax=Catharanthus roseus TaxID=4058 RepID=A0ACC0BD60_CATRO|nr:hypothetical protein M9H77_10922 [Catharanthus roseus]
MHEHAIWDAWHKRASLRYKNLMYEMTTAQFTNLLGEDGQGLCIVGTICPTASAEGTVDRYTIRSAKYQEMKANANHLYIDTGSPF